MIADVRDVDQAEGAHGCLPFFVGTRQRHPRYANDKTKTHAPVCMQGQSGPNDSRCRRRVLADSGEAERRRRTVAAPEDIKTYVPVPGTTHPSPRAHTPPRRRESPSAPA